ncbi:ABC transporter ATP-binding protein [Luteococcus sp.]|uniref:ABC transporter ATP-binding protein n=1 Tax=Luteococcus sp. TaxID=1969402 RepID=UPI00373563F2
MPTRLDPGNVPDAPPTLLQYVAQLTKGHRGVLAAAVALSVISAVVTIFQPRLLQKAVNDGIQGQLATRTVEQLAALVATATVIAAVQSYLAGRGSEAVAHELRSRISERYVEMTVEERDRSNSADLLSRATVDSLMVKQFLAAGVLPVFGSLIMIVGMAAFMVTADLLLFAVTAASFVIGLVLVLTVTGRANRMSTEVQESLGSFSVSVDRVLAALRIVKATNAQSSELRHLIDSSRGVYRTSMRITRLSAWIQPALNVCVQAAIAAVIIVGTQRLAQGALTLGGFLAYLMYMFMIIVPIGALGGALTQTQVGLGALRRCHEIEFVETEADAQVTARPVPTEGSPLLEFDAVTFGYEESVPTLQYVSFSLQVGERLTVLGRSGAGKSTLLELVERFYTPSSGQIRFKGVPIEELEMFDYRRRLALVPQEASILSGTLRDNLLVGGANRDDDTLTRVLHKVGLTDLLGKSHFGLDADLGQAGVSLSGGQRQRIAWAQVLLSDAELVLMDEPDANLDPATRRSLAAILDEFSKDRALVVVSHGVERLNPEDRVLILNQGQVAGDGLLEELSDCNTSFQELLAAPQAA